MVIILYCLGNDDEKNVYSTDVQFFSQYFPPCLVESMDLEPTDKENQP